MRNGIIDLAAGLFALLIAAFFQFQSDDLQGVSLLYPRLLIGFIALGGIWLLGKGLFGKGRGATKADAEPVALKRVGLISVVSIAYVLLIPVLGFYSASILFLLGAGVLLNDTGHSPVRAAGAACVLALVMCTAVWAGFSLLLHVPTPEGLLF